MENSVDKLDKKRTSIEAGLFGRMALKIHERWEDYVAVGHNAMGESLTPRDIARLTPPNGNPIVVIEQTAQSTDS